MSPTPAKAMEVFRVYVAEHGIRLVAEEAKRIAEAPAEGRLRWQGK